jgi:hypothetical protein
LRVVHKVLVMAKEVMALTPQLAKTSLIDMTFNEASGALFAYLAIRPDRFEPEEAKAICCLAMEHHFGREQATLWDSESFAVRLQLYLMALSNFKWEFNHSILFGNKLQGRKFGFCPSWEKFEGYHAPFILSDALNETVTAAGMSYPPLDGMLPEALASDTSASLPASLPFAGQEYEPHTTPSPAALLRSSLQASSSSSAPHTQAAVLAVVNNLAPADVSGEDVYADQDPYDQGTDVDEPIWDPEYLPGVLVPDAYLVDSVPAPPSSSSVAVTVAPLLPRALGYVAIIRPPRMPL